MKRSEPLSAIYLSNRAVTTAEKKYLRSLKQITVCPPFKLQPDPLPTHSQPLAPGNPGCSQRW
eukprot:1177343-Prorocentrum_minimum.AAC.1